MLVFFFFQAEDGIRDLTVTGVQTCALPISLRAPDGLPQVHALDPERAARGPTPVRGSGVPRRAQGAQPQLRQGSRLGDLGAGPVTSSRRFKDHFSDVAAAHAAHRPAYPAGLLDFLGRLPPPK